MGHPMVVEFLGILHDQDAFTGNNGQTITSDNPPAWRAGELDEIRPIGQHFCCPDMADQIKNGHIAFGSRKNEVYHNKLTEVFIRVENGARILPGGKQKPKLNTDIAIPYCPFCNAAIITMEIDSSNGNREGL
jgi:hypothetical protein